VVEAELDDLANVEFETSDNVEVIKTFDSMSLKEDLLRGIFGYGKVLKFKIGFFTTTINYNKSIVISIRAHHYGFVNVIFRIR